MNLKLRNTLISVGALTLIGIAAAGLVVSIQTHKEAQKDDASAQDEGMSSEAIFNLLDEADKLYYAVPDNEKASTYPAALFDARDKFFGDWTTCRFPDEKDFNAEDNNGFELEHELGQLVAMIAIMKNPTMEATVLHSREDIHEIWNGGWAIFNKIPADKRTAHDAVALKDALRIFDVKWTTAEWPAEADFSDELKAAFAQLKTAIDKINNPTA